MHALSVKQPWAELIARGKKTKPEDFDRATSSFMVDSRMRRADSLAKTYFITSVPTVVVGGKYSTNLTMAGGPDKLMAVVDFLVEKIRKERK